MSASSLISCDLDHYNTRNLQRIAIVLYCENENTSLSWPSISSKIKVISTHDFFVKDIELKQSSNYCTYINLSKHIRVCNFRLNFVHDTGCIKPLCLCNVVAFYDAKNQMTERRKQNNMKNLEHEQVKQLKD